MKAVASEPTFSLYTGSSQTSGHHRPPDPLKGRSETPNACSIRCLVQWHTRVLLFFLAVFCLGARNPTNTHTLLERRRTHQEIAGNGDVLIHILQRVRGFRPDLSRIEKTHINLYGCRKWCFYSHYPVVIGSAIAQPKHPILRIFVKSEPRTQLY